MTVYEAVQLMKQEGSRLATPVSVEGMPSMIFDCTFSGGATANEVSRVLADCPKELSDFWSEARSARLFVDQQYEQWGLEILAPPEALQVTNEYHEERGSDFLHGDFIFGRFLGDSDLLMIRCDRSAEDFGCVVVVLPLDRRSDWDRVADSFAEFLANYVNSGGEKFWTKEVS